MVSNSDEKLTYTNENNEMIIIARIRPYLLLSKTGFGTGSNTIESEKLHGADGELEMGSSLDPRVLSINFLVYGETTEEDITLQRRVLDVFNPKLKGTLAYESFGKSYEIDVRITKGWDGEFDERTHTFQGSISFVGLQPLWRDTSSEFTTIQLGQVTNLFSFPLEIFDNFKFATVDYGKEISVQNPGHVAVGLELNIECTAAVQNPKLLNPYTQEYFAFNYTFKGGDKIYLNTNDGKKEVLINGENGFFRRKLGSTFLQISNLETNYFVLQADSGIENMVATMTYYPLLTGVC